MLTFSIAIFLKIENGGGAKAKIGSSRNRFSLLTWGLDYTVDSAETFELKKKKVENLVTLSLLILVK